MPNGHLVIHAITPFKNFSYLSAIIGSIFFPTSYEEPICKTYEHMKAYGDHHLNHTSVQNINIYNSKTPLGREELKMAHIPIFCVVCTNPRSNSGVLF